MVFSGRDDEQIKVIEDVDFTKNDPSQRQMIDQVFCAALNISQGQSGYNNRGYDRTGELRSFLLDVAYSGTYLAAIRNRRKKVFLTLIGGGAFGNDKEKIFEAIVKAHKKYTSLKSNSIEEVVLVLFSEWDYCASFKETLQNENIKSEYICHSSSSSHPEPLWTVE